MRSMLTYAYAHVCGWLFRRMSELSQELSNSRMRSMLTYAYADVCGCRRMSELSQELSNSDFEAREIGI
jgi:hypothetical protein